MKKLIVSISILLTIFISQSNAIPAFARKYDMSCQTCHSPAPKLKPYGEEFAGNGFQFPDKEPPRYYRETGDDQLLLMREMPLAIRVEGYGRWQPETNKRSDFQTPYLVKLLSGGQIARNISYYFYFFFGERGSVAGLEDAFIMFNNVFESELDVFVGQFQVSDPLFKRELRLTLEDYQVYRIAPGISNINLTYDRGMMFSYSLPTKTDLVVEILNGSGIGPADGQRNFDSDKYKNVFARASQDISDGIRIGGFAYYGKEENLAKVNSLWIAGPDISLSIEPIELNVQYVERRDDNPNFLATNKTVETRGSMAELIYSPNGDKSVWYGALLYNWAEIPSQAYTYTSVTGHYSYLLARNMRLIGEYTYDIEKKGNKLTVGFIGAF
ncbi:MAG TPA: hypothetical protein DCQ28_10025 [Bacteroidetes bacterium]|nr:hypothetical protein [Bacteroidota bacterium]